MRATLTGVDDSKDLQVLQVNRLAGETIDGCERIGQYGLTSNPPIGAECIVAQVSSNADHQVILGVDDKSRPHPLLPGETVLYSAAGTTVKLDSAGNIEITCSGAVIINSSALTVQASTMVLDGDLTVTGTSLLNGNVIMGGTLNGHTP